MFNENKMCKTENYISCVLNLFLSIRPLPHIEILNPRLYWERGLSLDTAKQQVL
jgi:hypothetical protein